MNYRHGHVESHGEQEKIRGFDKSETSSFIKNLKEIVNNSNALTTYSLIT